MEHRHLGRSGLKVSEIAYGNWITHGSQVEEDAARACVEAALDEGITTFDTADAYAGTRAEEVLGRALRGVRRESYRLPFRIEQPQSAGTIAQRRDHEIRLVQDPPRRRWLAGSIQRTQFQSRLGSGASDAQCLLDQFTRFEPEAAEPEQALGPGADIVQVEAGIAISQCGLDGGIEDAKRSTVQQRYAAFGEGEA